MIEHPPLITPPPGSVVYSFSSQPYSEERHTIVQAEEIPHVHYGSLLGFTGPYYEQPQYHDQVCVEQHQQEYYQPDYPVSYPRKRPRIETNTNMPSAFSSAHPYRSEHEKSPVSVQYEREDDSRGSFIGAISSCLVSSMCPPSFSNYETTAGKTHPPASLPPPPPPPIRRGSCTRASWIG